ELDDFTFARSDLLLGNFFERAGQISLLKPDFSVHHLPDALGQYRGRAVFHENSGDTLANQFGRLQITDAGGDDQDFAAGSRILGVLDELRSFLRPEIEVQKHQIDGSRREYLHSIIDRRAVGHDLAVRLRLQKARDAFAEQRVIINDED